MAAEPERDRLPFEPTKKRQKPTKSSASPPVTTPKKSEQSAGETKKNTQSQPPYTAKEMAVPKIVSDRMARRMAVLCGVPTALGMATFIASYLVVSHGWFKLPNVAVVLTSMGCFGLGVIGLSYGVLSASWDEEVVGSRIGLQEFKTNWGRMISTWRATRQNKA